MSLPRELYLDGNGSLRSRPARELDSARHKTLITQPIHGRGTAGVCLSARSAHATEMRITPVCGKATAILIRLAGRRCEDVEVRVTADGVAVTEGNRALTVPIPPPRSAEYQAQPIGQVRLYYDSGILEVYSPLAGPAAVICNRYAVYASIDIELSTLFEAPSCAACVTVWSCGRS
jgi:sucrose-6-phosphate hydrolase SacC (GH32 family)